MTKTPSKRNVSAAISLFLVAPLVAEYLLGDLPLKLLPALIVLAPVYGGAAILIRETARRTSRGWPTMLLLGTAYALIAEGLITQSLFNHDYLKIHMHLLDHAYIPAWGIGAWWTLFMFNLHTFWSIGVSIALAESLFPAQAKTPWLGLLGESIMAVVFLLGAAADYAIGFRQNQFIASPTQLLIAAVASLLLIVLAFLIPARKPRNRIAPLLSPSPGPWATGSVTLLFGIGVLYTPPMWGWGAVAALLAIDTAFLILLIHFSRQSAWNPQHTLSVAAGGALAYGLHAFTQKPLIGGLLGMRITNAVMLATAITLIWLAAPRILQPNGHPDPSQT